MTYRELIKSITDEYERMIIIGNLARECPYYDSLSTYQKRKTVQELLDRPVRDKEEKNEIIRSATDYEERT